MEKFHKEKKRKDMEKEERGGKEDMSIEGRGR